MMGPPPSKDMAFYQERIEDLEFRGHGLYIGRCPACGEKELRVFDENPVEVRCGKCRFWAFGADQFAQFTEKFKPEVDNAGSQDQSEGRGDQVPPETPESQIH